MNTLKDKIEALAISFFIPAYNCQDTIRASVESILDSNFETNDELIITNDGSSDNTAEALAQLQLDYPQITIVQHNRNKGGAAARNTAVEHAQNTLLFCLDSDNILVRNSIAPLKSFLINSGADAASFQELRYFQDSTDNITHSWCFEPKQITFADALSGSIVPIASGNYLFTRESWLRAGGYPEFAKALDAWGFGLRQLATGSKMLVLEDTFYFHRAGHESYWMRFQKENNVSLGVLQILLPFLDLIEEADVDYIMSREGRYTWFSECRKRPIKVKDEAIGQQGIMKKAKEKPKLNIMERGWHKLKYLIKKHLR